MNRRDFLQVLGAMSLFGCTTFSGRSGLGQSTLQVQTRQRVASLSPDFLGLSFESALLGTPFFFHKDNQSLVSFCRELGPGAVLRLGGFYGQYSLWSRSATTVEPPYRFNITPDVIDRLAAFLEAIDWKLVYGLNMGHGSPERAADEADYVAKRLGPRLLAFQLGHEPDMFVARKLRPQGYDAQAYAQEWLGFARAIQLRVPNAVFGGPDLAGDSQWLSVFNQTCGSAVAFLSEHYLALPAKSPNTDWPTLLLEEPARFQVGPAVAAQEATRAGRLYRLTDVGVSKGSGWPGLSDTLGAALWAIHMLYRSAAAGVDGVYFHAGPGGAASPFALDSRTMSLTARPLLYGLYLARKTLPGDLVQSRLQTDQSLLQAYAVVSGAMLNVVLINFSETENQDVVVQADRTIQGGAILPLQGERLGSRSGVHFAGSVLRPGKPWQSAAEQSIEMRSGQTVLPVRAGSAVLAQLRLSV